MVHRVSYRRLLLLTTFVTFSIIVFQTWTTYTTDHNVSYAQPDEQSLSKNELSKEQSQNELSKTTTFQQIHFKHQLLKKFPFKEIFDFKKTIDNNINGEVVDDADEEEDSNKEPNDLKTDNTNQEAPGSKSEVGQLLKSNEKDLPPLSYPITGEIEKTDASVSVKSEDSSTLATQDILIETNKDLSNKNQAIQETLVETDKGLSNKNQAIQETLVETDKGLSNKNQSIQNTLVETNKDFSKNNQTASEKQTTIETSKTPKEKYWFFKNGTLRPTKSAENSDNLTSKGKLKIWPHEAPNNDRIVDQLMYIPDTYNPSQVKTILLANHFSSWGVEPGLKVFQECPVNACTLSMDWKQNESADAILFRDTLSNAHDRKPSQNKQIWIIYELESAVHSSLYGFDSQHREQINWTATYRMDSDMVTPYEKWVYYDERHKTDAKNREVNFAAGKTRQVAWFVSNCNAPNKRVQYAQELQKYIPVDIYGSCGPLTCPRSSKCFELLDKDYKFYLSFENSNCKDYITEKFFANGLSHNVLPIVMGAPKSDYLRSAPVNSFIHVEDFASPKQLAQYLHQLNENDTAYNEYFQWKGTGEFINTFFWCRLCTMVHDGGSAIVGKYTDVRRWWHEGVCEKTG